MTCLFRRTLPLAAALFLTGCMGPRAYDVTSQPAWWGDLRLNEVVELNQDTLLNGGVLELTSRKFTRSNYDTQRVFGVNVTVEMFKTDPGGYWADLYLVRKGTQLRCVKLERWFSSDTAVYRVSAEILTGELKGKIAYLVPWGDPRKKGSLELGPHPLVHPLGMLRQANMEEAPLEPAPAPQQESTNQPNGMGSTNFYYKIDPIH
jgi:hypothetical protein